MNIADTELKIEALTKKITKARKDHKTSSKMVADQKRLRNTILAHDKIKDFANKEKAKKAAVEQRIDEANRNQKFDTYRPLGQTEQPTHDEIRREMGGYTKSEPMEYNPERADKWLREEIEKYKEDHPEITINYDDTLKGPVKHRFIYTGDSSTMFPELPPTLWQRVKSFFARWF